MRYGASSDGDLNEFGMHDRIGYFETIMFTDGSDVEYGTLQQVMNDAVQIVRFVLGIAMTMIYLV